MKVKDFKAILNRYEESDDLYLFLENGWGKTIRYGVSMNKVDRHFSQKEDDQNEVIVCLGWEN